ncbi:MAG: hypothetical protein JRG90_01860 [Deltaproteobacteria bacterium]|nr:hypothetical protein [Deltaproteobacteria bacterium]
MLQNGLEIRGVGRILDQEILLNELELHEEVLPQDLDLMEGDDVLELRDDFVDGESQVETTRNEARGQYNKANEESSYVSRSIPTLFAYSNTAV